MINLTDESKLGMVPEDPNHVPYENPAHSMGQVNSPDELYDYYK